MGSEVPPRTAAEGSPKAESPAAVPGLGKGVLGIDGLLALAAWILVLLLGLLFSHRLYFTPRNLGPPLLATALVMLASTLCRRRPWRGIEEWWPFILMVALYMQLAPYTQVVHQGAFDAQLLALDLRLFGFAPSETMAALHHPWPTEILTLAYASYFILPLGAAAPTYMGTEDGRMRNRAQFRAILTAHVLVQAVGFLGYILVPARGPRWFLPDPVPLHGAIGYYEFALHNWTAIQAVPYDAFPSLHTANAVLAIVHSFRGRVFFRPLPWLITPPSVLLIISTIYLRMHYAVDVLAGLLMASLVVWFSPQLVQWTSPTTGAGR